jgi:TolA-binding protein
VRRAPTLALAVTAALAAAAAARAAEPVPYVSCQDRSERAKSQRGGIVRRHEARPLVTEEQARGELEESVRRWDEEARAFRGEVAATIQKQFDERRRFLSDNYEQAIRDLETLERNEREAAIVRFEEFLGRYPDDAQYTPDAMFRLAELYYE